MTQAPLTGEPFAFQWHITDACDQRCKHCYLYAEDVARRPSEMSWDQIERTFARILEFCEAFGRRPYLYLTSGDRSCTRTSGDCSPSSTRAATASR